MSIKRQLKPNVYFVGAIDWDKRLFDELIPLPDGTSYNAYLVEGSEQTALIDTVDPEMADVLIENLRDVEKIDYVIANHAEQDHSGTLPQILERYPDAKVVTNPKCKVLLMEMVLIPEEKFVTVADGETLSLGDKTLEFIYAPWVHWPETMLTYLQEDKLLFSCDFFGSHLATSDLFVTPAQDSILCYTSGEVKIYEPAKRYYAEIMMPFRMIIKKNLEKIKSLEIEMIAPSHGPAYDKPSFIIDAYREWSSDQVKNEVVVPYISMHGSTKKMIEYFVAALIERGITVKQFDLADIELGKLAMSLVDAATIVIGSPTVLTGAHPNVVYAAYLANALRPKLKFASIIGSYGWGSKMVKQITELIGNLKVEILDPVVVKGFPKADDLFALDRLADEILSRHKNLGKT